jgi:hypothetical protein
MGFGLKRRLGALTSCVVLGGSLGASAAVWQDVPPAKLQAPAPERVLVGPHRVVRLDEAQLTALLAVAPAEFDAWVNPPVLELPWPDGGTRRFGIEVSPVMEPGLAQKFPEIQTYRGRGLDDRTALARIDRTPAGFHAIVLSSAGTVYVDPWSRGDRQHYVSYFKRDYRRRDGTEFRCHFDADNPELTGDEGGLASHFGLPPAAAFGDTLRNYRLAQAANVEYTAFHGGTVPLAMAAIVTAINRVNTVYERDLAVHMNLVANNDLIVYTVEPDPYTNNNGVTMLGQNQTNLTNVIGAANYDIGHVFSTGGGGVASLGVVCNNAAKARGVTGLSQPIGDPFYIDYVAHEMGHQFRGNHSFNGTTGACGGGNRNPATAWEPGSGSTIMAYAGICGAENLQPNSDDVFHVGNLLEMQSFITTGTGSLCPATVATGNAAPVVDGGPDYTIPQTTPFTLTATGSDPNGEPLVYIWEQMDIGAAAPPNTDNGNRPIFRSFNVTSSPSRTFPRLSDVLANTLTFGEAWPTTDRNLNFRVTARDNHPGAGGTTIDPVVVTVVAAAGPFAVTAPNTSVTWTGFDAQTVTWSVAGTDAPPISAANVRISLSTDGGATFPAVLAASTPNDGSEVIGVPNTPTTQARVKVEALGNVFFDIGNANFNIVPGGGPGASIADASVTEGNAGTTPASFTVTLTASTGSPVTVDYATANGTATVANNDYQAVSGTLTFAPGQTSRVVTVSVVGDLTPELDETFFVNLSNLTGGGTINDGQGVGTIVNDDGLIPERLELIHGTATRRSLAAVAGQQKRDDYRLAQKPQSSYEVVVDEASGDLTPIVLQRLDASGTTVLQASQPVGTGTARALRWENAGTTEITNEVIRVGSGGCTTNCGADDTYRVRAYETTFSIPRFNNSGSQVTVLVLQNPTDAPVQGTVNLWSTTGALLGSQLVTVDPKNVAVIVTSTIPGGAAASGSITISHNGAYGSLAGKTVALEPSTGFSFDSPMLSRQR